MTRTRRSSRSRRSRGKARPGPERRMLMNVVEPEEVRVAIVGPSGLEELYIERAGSGYVHGNIYKGKVENVEPSLQAAFVDIGGEKNGFLHVSDVVPPHGGYEGLLKKRRKKYPKDTRRMLIEDMLYKGQELLVQITREQLANKGPSLTTYVSMPGRYLVMMPAVNKRGVSRKITDEKERRELKAALDRLDPPKDFGFIIRTAGTESVEGSLRNDLAYLMRLWEAIEERTRKVKAPATIYQESDLVIRSIRDYLYGDVDELLIDSEPEYKRAREFLRMVMPAMESRAKVYTSSDPLFHHFGIDREIENTFARSCRLASGGEIVIEQTEAMVTIDVNTGSFKKAESSAEMILAINLEAAAEVARQLRLRDLGGLIMVDFVDMESRKDRKQVEDAMRTAMAGDRARVSMLPISQLGVMEMTRQRVRQSLKSSFYIACPECGGTGLRKAPEIFALEFVRTLRTRMEERTGTLNAYLHPEAIAVIFNSKRDAIDALERERGSRVCLMVDTSIRPDQMRFEWQR